MLELVLSALKSSLSSTSSEPPTPLCFFEIIYSFLIRNLFVGLIRLIAAGTGKAVLVRSSGMRGPCKTYPQAVLLQVYL